MTTATRRLSLEAATLDLSSGQLWDTAVLATLTVRTAWALGRAVHSAGLAGPPPWPNGREFVTMYDAFSHQLAAQRTRTRRPPLHITHATRDHASGDGLPTDGECDRLSHLDPSYSVVAELAVMREGL